MPEQRRVKAGSTVILPCYAATTHSSRESDASKYFSMRQRPRREQRAPRDFVVDDVTGRKLRHSRRARPGASSGGWRYEWRRDDEPIAASGSVYGKFSVDSLDQSLTIRNASSVTDTAMYSCVRRRRSHGNDANSSNTDDVITSRQIQLVVEGNCAVYYTTPGTVLTIIV